MRSRLSFQITITDFIFLRIKSPFVVSTIVSLEKEARVVSGLVNVSVNLTNVNATEVNPQNILTVV